MLIHTSSTKVSTVLLMGRSQTGNSTQCTIPFAEILESENESKGTESTSTMPREGERCGREKYKEAEGNV